MLKPRLEQSGSCHRANKRNCPRGTPGVWLWGQRRSRVLAMRGQQPDHTRLDALDQAPNAPCGLWELGVTAAATAHVDLLWSGALGGSCYS